jgi:hypothetical protein
MSSAVTGRVERVLLPDLWHGMRVSSTALEKGGQVLVTLSSGPVCTSDVEGCGPKPNSCAGEVVALQTKGGSPHVVIRASDNELIGDAQPSPDGHLLAYLDGVCNASYLNQYIRIRDLDSGRSWTIGSALKPCHSFSSMSWTPNGRELVVAYGASDITGSSPSLGFGHGGCQQPAANELAVVPARNQAANLPGARTPVDPGCEATAVTALKNGYAEIETCGYLYISGRATLILFNGRRQVVSRWPLGSCIDGAELRAAPGTSDLLGTSYQYCALSGTTQPRTVTFIDVGKGPKTIINVPNGGEDAVSSMSW